MASQELHEQAMGLGWFLQARKVAGAGDRVEFGARNVRLESWPFGKGWQLDKFTFEMVEPRYMPLVAFPEAWSAPTSDELLVHPLLTAGKSLADVQSMAWDVYQMQATSNNGNQLVQNMVAGTGQNFDVVMTAVNNSPTTSYDAFINNEVDLADIHAERSLPLPNTATHPQAQESVYAHFLHERQFDATHAGTNMTAINTQQQALEAQRVQLLADRAALPARVQTALGGGAVAPPLTAAETAQATAWTTRATTWNAARVANDAAFNARFTAAHSYAIDQENAYNRERGFDDARPH